MNSILDNRPNEIKFQDLISLVQELMQRFHVPGVSIGLIADGKDYTAGLGVTSITNPLPVTPETIFQIGSTTKTFTATALVLLAQEGKLSLDDHVRKFLPDFKVADENAAAGVTIRHLLNHTSGWIGDFFPETGPGDDAISKYVALMVDLPQKTPLGAYYSYNNAALVVAGRVIEVITGKTYEAAIREMIFEPLGMSNSFFFSSEVMVHRFAVGHVMQDQEVIVAQPWPIIRGGHPAGGVASDIPDQLRYARFHMGDGTAPGGERLLTPESLKLMQTPTAPTGDGDSIGLTWAIEDIGGVRFYCHGGTTNGQESDFWIAPEKGVALTVLTNLDRGDQVHKAARDWVREHFLGVKKELPATIQLPLEKLQEYAKTFTTSVGDLLEFRPDQGGMIMTHILIPHPEQGDQHGEPFSPMRTAFFASDQFLVLDPPFTNSIGEFLRDENGKITWMRLGGRLFPLKP
jgi:CubicO group peptidase (beta-lactamase class C family)